MNEDLRKYQKELGNLTKEEQKERDLYLRKLSLGEIQGPPVGYASIDKPWLKYYKEESIKKDFEPMSAYQLMMSKNVGHEKDIAIEYFGNKITYKQLFKNIDLTAKALLEMGVKKGDVVMMSMPNTPEAEYLFYAINKIGAVINSIDPRQSYDEILQDIKDTKPKLFFGIDVIYPKTKKFIDDGVKVINISGNNSLPLPIKILANMKNKPNKKIMTWDDFIKFGKNSSIKEVETVYDKDSLAAIVHTGGSTGTPKGVMLTNENLNGLIYQMMYGYDNFYRGQRFLNILPPFIALGLNNAMHLSACLGLKSIMIPTFEPEDIPKLISKHKPNVFLCGPIHLNMMMKDKILQDADLSYLEVICSGGDKVPLKQQDNFQKFLEEHNSNAKIWLGYGATETSAGISCMTDQSFTYESVGIPYQNNVVTVFNTDTNQEENYNVRGEIRVNAPTIMKGYTGFHSNETQDVISVDENNKKWYHTGDIGHIDENGRIFIDGRIKRIITRRGFKIYPQFIEEIILSHPYVKECAVVGVADEDEINIPVANVVLGDNYKSKEGQREVEEYTQSEISKALPEYSQMAGYNFLDELPRTPIGKLDFKLLEEQGIINNKHKIKQKSLM